MNKVYDMSFLIRECFEHGGDSFDVEESFSWSEEYRPKKILFCGYEWALSGPGRFYGYYDRMVEFENTLKALSPGISYTRRDILKRDWSRAKPKGPFDSEYRYYETQFVIHVSKNYSSSIVDSAGRSRTYICNDLDANTLSRAYAFKSKVICKYPDLIKDLYSDYLRGADKITKDGAGGEYCSRPLVCTYSKYGLKPLKEDFQILGVALAVTELGSYDLNDAEYLELVLWEGSYVHISKIVKCIKPKLSEW